MQVGGMGLGPVSTQSPAFRFLDRYASLEFEN